VPREAAGQGFFAGRCRRSGRACRLSALPRQAALATPPATGRKRSPSREDDCRSRSAGGPKVRLLRSTEREDSSERLGETREHHRRSPPSVERFERPPICQRSAARTKFSASSLHRRSGDQDSSGCAHGRCSACACWGGRAASRPSSDGAATPTGLCKPKVAGFEGGPNR